LYLGLALAAAGWAALFLGWYQAGRQDLETGQIPYVLSGGFGGWGLLAMGALGVLMDFVRQAEWRAHRHLHELQRALEQLGDSLKGRAKSPSPADSDGKPVGARGPRRRSRRQRSGAQRERGAETP
jgi:hypothetical protein